MQKDFGHDYMVIVTQHVCKCAPKQLESKRFVSKYFFLLQTKLQFWERIKLIAAKIKERK